MRRSAGGLLLLLAAACDGGAPIPELELALRIATDAEFVELGKAFPLTVVRIWEQRLTPEPWDDRLLAPLHVDLLGTQEHGDGTRRQETRRYRAHAFARDRLVLPPITVRASGRDGSLHEATSSELVLKIAPALLAGDGPAPELPLEPFGAETGRGRLAWIATGVAFVLLLLGLGWRQLRGRPTPRAVVPPAPPPPPEAVALARLERLRRQSPQGRAEQQQYHIEASALLRDYVAARFDVPAPHLTTERTLAALREGRHASAAGLTALGTCLQQCDEVKFAGAEPSAVQRSQLLDAAGRVLQTGAMA